MNKTFTAVLLNVVGTQVEIQYTAVRVHVPGKYYQVPGVYRTYFATTNSNSSNNRAIVSG